jgi:hypothetical protein
MGGLEGLKLNKCLIIKCFKKKLRELTASRSLSLTVSANDLEILCLNQSSFVIGLRTRVKLEASKI